MRGVGILILAGLGILTPVMASAQDRGAPRDWNSYRGLSADDMNAYCFWNGQLYSLGASFCSRQTSSATCTEAPGKRPIWVIRDNDQLCEKNPSITPQ
jgi:hypothetical protein